MSATTPARVVNRLIDSLPHRERQRFVNSCVPVDLVFGTLLCEADQPLQHVYFPLVGFISLLAPLTGHAPLEMGLVGNEGMLGATVALGVSTAPMKAVVQGAGTALRMSVVRLRSELRDNPRLLQTINRYVFILMAQLSRSAACTHFHEIGLRLARWLLMTHDRAHADQFYLTHQLLADMLGVRRSGVTIAAGVLQRRRLIRYVRGEVSILNRPGLEAAACECYGGLLADYALQLTEKKANRPSEQATAVPPNP